ncbi:MAG TPA: aminotransferase class III-fold pyridoxal phosphate-dependent enzyme [Mycobacteriales bacterium]|jgi:glutamate-1-semialdehyde 2,1-aminomutase|nr:aminotransferase class III-fold pyridoxal phosphate-dependent enzyme [Mycobacteriales bacterium]
MTLTDARFTQLGEVDAALRQRARSVIPGGMYGHQSVARLPAGYPQFFSRGEGTTVWDVDGRPYLDLMCSYGPVVLGHRHPRVEAAARAQADLGDCFSGPSAVMVELSELLVATVRHADWAVLAKNGTDAMTMCLTIARAATGRRKVLVAGGAYHGAAPWCTPSPVGVLPEDRAHLVYYRYNDLDSLREAVASCGDDLAAVVVSPFRHDARFDQEIAEPAFAREARAQCDATGAALVLDDVRAGFRLHHGASWEPLGVDPDLSAWSKAIANGHPLAAVLGSGRFREGAEQIFVTGSFWFSAVAMAAAVATLHELRESDGVARMVRAGQRLRDGLTAQAGAHGVVVQQTGPVQMPLMSFADDPDWARAGLFADEAVRRGVYLHPWHNWFTSAAHTDEDIDRALLVTDDAFAAVRRQLG